MTTHTFTALIAGLLLLGCSSSSNSTSGDTTSSNATSGNTTSGNATFATPEAAVQRLLDSATDREAADELLGAGGFELLRSGDEVSDKLDFERAIELARERLAFEDVTPDHKLALFGTDGWEFPIPLVREEGLWRFDVEAGREEILNRRVGRNELCTLETLRVLVEAQRLFAAQSDGGKRGPYAKRVLSSDGQRDGLYWPVPDGEPESPLGPFVAEAFEEGYRADQPTPYHGYCYRLLEAQGASAPGGARSYLDDKGALRGGFGVIAWPATYGNSGVMSFIINQQGIVFERDLGQDTDTVARAIKAYDPDEQWLPNSD